MKKLLLTFLLGIFLLNVSAQTYHEDDKEGLRKILRQKGEAWTNSGGYKPYTATNFELFDLTEADTLTWYTDEAWVDKVTEVTAINYYREGIVWNNNSPRSISHLGWYLGVLNTLFKLSDFKMLERVNIQTRKYGLYDQYVVIDLSDCPNIKQFEVARPSYTSNSFVEDNNIEVVSSYDIGGFDFTKSPNLLDVNVGGGFVDLSNSPKVKTLHIGINPGGVNLSGALELEDFMYYSSSMAIDTSEKIDLSDCVNLKRVHIGGYNTSIKSIDLSNNLKLEDVSIRFLTNLTSDIVFGNINPKRIEINECVTPSRALDFSKMTNLKTIKCPGNRLRRLLLPETSMLDTVDFHTNALPLSQFPLQSFSELNYAHQVDNDTIYAPCILDLSNEYVIDGHLTEFIWEVYDPQESKYIKFNPTHHNNGVFEIPESLVDKWISVKMPNERFPEMVYLGLSTPVWMNFQVLSKGPTVGIDGDQIGNLVRLESTVIREGNPIVFHAEESGLAQLYTLGGQLLSVSKVIEGRSEIAVSTSGLYLLKVVLNNGASKTFKVIVK